jgi:hypothetical protein
VRSYYHQVAGSGGSTQYEVNRVADTDYSSLGDRVVASCPSREAARAAFRLLAGRDADGWGR